MFQNILCSLKGYPELWCCEFEGRRQLVCSALYGHPGQIVVASGHIEPATHVVASSGHMVAASQVVAGSGQTLTAADRAGQSG